MKQSRYQETEYDVKLRKHTLRDTLRTIVITCILFALQYVVVAQAETIQGLFR